MNPSSCNNFAVGSSWRSQKMHCGPQYRRRLGTPQSAYTRQKSVRGGVPLFVQMLSLDDLAHLAAGSLDDIRRQPEGPVLS
jgi:hypothetical protein